MTYLKFSFVFITFATLLLFFLFIIIFYLAKRKRTIIVRHVLGMKMDHEKVQLQTQLDIQQNVLQNISREIHDNIGLSLTLAKLSLLTIDHGDQLQRKTAIGFVIDLIAKTIEELQDIPKNFGTDTISNIGLATALELETEKIQRSQTHNISFIRNGEPSFIEPNSELVLFRIAQEALNNILQHAKAQNIQIELLYAPDNVSLSICDDGVGFDWNDKKITSNEKMSGLKNMKMRANLIQGDLTINSNSTSGTTITITAPL